MKPKKRQAAKAKSVIAKLEDLIGDDSMLRNALEQAWFINHINYLGFQYTLVDSETGAIDEIPNDVKFRANKIQNHVSHTVAKITSEPPDWDVDSDTDQASIQSSKRVAEALLEYVWDKENMQIKTRDLATYVRVYGTGIIGPIWDKDAGKALDPDEMFPQEGRELEDIDALAEIFEGDMDAAKRFLSGEDKIRDGDLRISVMDPFDVYPDPAADDEESCGWVIIKRLTSVNDVKTRYDVEVEPEEIGEGGGLSLKYQIRRHVSPNVQAGGSASTRIEDSVEVNEYWERTSKKHPKGRLVVWANGELLREGENPFHGTTAEIPICRARDMPRISGFWGACATDNAIPIQRNYNKSRSNMIQNGHDHAQNKWMIARGAAVSAGALDRTSNEVLEYNLVSTGTGAPVKPERIMPGMVSNLDTSALELCNMELDETYGISDISKGQAPTGVSAGVALDLLLKESDTRLGAVTAELNSCYARLGKMVLDIYKRYVDEPRQFTEIVGIGKQGDVLEFVGSDLSYRNVRVRMGSMVERRRLRRRQTAVELIQYLPPEMWQGTEARQAVFAAVGFEDAMPSADTVDVKRGKKIISQIKEGGMPPILPWQNHEVILSVLTEWMNGLEFDEEDDRVQQLAVQHWQDRIASIPPPPMMGLGMDPQGGMVEPGMEQQSQAGELPAPQPGLYPPEG